MTLFNTKASGHYEQSSWSKRPTYKGVVKQAILFGGKC